MSQYDYGNTEYFTQDENWKEFYAICKEKFFFDTMMREKDFLLADDIYKCYEMQVSKEGKGNEQRVEEICATAVDIKDQDELGSDLTLISDNNICVIIEENCQLLYQRDTVQQGVVEESFQLEVDNMFNEQKETLKCDRKQGNSQVCNLRKKKRTKPKKEERKFFYKEKTVEPIGEIQEHSINIVTHKGTPSFLSRLTLTSSSADTPHTPKACQNNSRKYKPDGIRKKIKSRTHKKIKLLLNKKLKEAGSRMFFDFLPQCFINNINRKFNQKLMGLTLTQLYQVEFNGDDRDRRRVARNRMVIEYLNANKEILKKAKLSLVFNVTYGSLLNDYFVSRDFYEDVSTLIEEGEDQEYIDKYIHLSHNYVDYFTYNNNE